MPPDKRPPRSRERPAGHLRFVQQGADRTLEFSASSDQPISTAWADREILVHSDQAMNIQETLEGCAPPLLFGHNRDDYVGVCESARYENGRLIVGVRFDTHARAEQIYQSVLNGTLTGVSIGYEPLVWNTAPDGTLTIEKWRWLEVSITPLPADKTVGIGRTSPESPTPKTIGVPMSEQRANYAAHPEAIEAERERVNGLHLLGQRHDIHRSRVQQWINDGLTFEAATQECLAQWQSQGNQNPIRTIPPIGLSERDSRNYSVIRAIRSMVSKNRDEAGLEWDASRALAARLGRPSDQFFIPVSDLKVPTRAIAQRAGLPYQTGLPEAAGVLVELEVMPVTEAYRALTQVMALGATMLTGLQGNLSFPTHDAIATAAWVNEGQPLPDVNSELGSFTMTPRTTGAISSYTHQMLQQSSADLETWVRLDLATAVAEAIDLAAINGSGVGATPRGILQTAGVNVVSIGPNGGPLTWANVVDFERLVAQANAVKPTSRLGYLTSPKVAAHAKVREREVGTGNYLWEGTQIVSQGQRPGFGQMNSYPAAVSTHIPDNLTKGNGTGLSAMIFGDWSQLLIGEWGALQLDVNPYGRGWQSGTVEVRVMTLIDIALRRPAAFAVATDVDAD